MTESTCFRIFKCKIFAWWVLYEVIFLSLVIPLLVIGGLTVSQKHPYCKNIFNVDSYIWIFVLAGCIIALNFTLMPATHLFINAKRKTTCHTIHITFSVISVIIFFFVMVWCAVGLRIYVESLVCKPIFQSHAFITILAYSSIIFGLVGLILLATIIGVLVGCIRSHPIK